MRTNKLLISIFSLEALLSVVNLASCQFTVPFSGTFKDSRIACC